MPLPSEWQAKWFVLKSLASNPFHTGKLAYIVEARDWAIKYVGEQIISRLSLEGITTTSTWKLNKKILHFGSLHTILHNGRPLKLNKDNKHIISIFHIVSNKASNAFIPIIVDTVNVIHTSCQNTYQALLDLGISKEKIKIIPLGVDIKLFRPSTDVQKMIMRKKLNIPLDSYVIGSFQKDGVGWDNGNEPKLEKGPDVFIRVVSMVAKKYPVHILLVGPARGYIEKGLKKEGISYTSIGHIQNIQDVAPYYAALNTYLISSRIEGGPLTLLEAWASGVAVVSTRVGMVPDIGKNGENVLLAPVNDVTALTQHINHLIEDKNMQQRLTKSAQQCVTQYQWSKISDRYLKELYQPLLNQL